MKHRLRTVALMSLPLLLASLHAAAGTSDCSEKPRNSVKDLHSYMLKGGTGRESYSVTGVGNKDYMLDEDQNPVSPEDLAGSLARDAKFHSAEQVVLVWPYSAWGDASYAHALEKIIKKPVKGFSGPLWWYPDGVAIASRSGSSSHHEPNESNVAECITPAGKYGEGAECKSLLGTHKADKAIFGNAIFMLACDDIKKVDTKVSEANSRAYLWLYLYHAFVDIDEKKAQTELTAATSRGDPLANYLMALTMRRKSPPDEKEYRRFLHRAAMLGNARARDEIRQIRR